MTVSINVAAVYRHCGTCNIEQNHRRCAGCTVIQYCSKEHQAAHWAKHKSVCTKITKRRIELERDEQALRATPDDGFMHNGDPFITGVGHFWGLSHTRDYMRTRYRLIEAILEARTLDAVESALGHFMDILRLCRSDNMGVRSLVPALLLRLGRDQECYDFVKWWAITGEDSDYDWGDTSLPYLDTEDADMFEPVDLFCNQYLDLSHTVSVTLLKIRLLLALQKCLQNMAVLRESGSLPKELFDHIQDSLLKSVLGANWDNPYSTKSSQLVDMLSLQLDKLYKAADQANKHFWPALLDPGRNLEELPESYSRGSVQEMQLVLKYSIDSWKESPGALELIAAKR